MSMLHTGRHGVQCRHQAPEHTHAFARLPSRCPGTPSPQYSAPAHQQQQAPALQKCTVQNTLRCAAGNTDVNEAAKPGRLAVFCSGGGSNMRALHAACKDRRIAGEIAVVVSDHRDCGAMEYAEANGIPTIFYAPKKSSDPALHDELLRALQQTHDVNLVCLAGFLKLIPPQIVRAFRRRILNIHPALLPAFGGKGLYGMRVHEAVLKSGARYSGCTVHYVDEDYDTGPILAQACVDATPDMTAEELQARVLSEEHRLYSECVSAIVDGRVTWNGNNIPIIMDPT